MAIKNNQKAFTIIEVLVAMLLFSFILLASVKAYAYLTKNHKINEIRYLALNKIDSEMNRLVFAYENFDESGTNGFTFDDEDNDWYGDWDIYFFVPEIARWKDMKIYKQNPLEKPYGLKIDGQWSILRNTIEIVDKNNNPNVVDTGDIVGVMAWRVQHNPNETHPVSVHISLSITYPYTATIETHQYGNDETKVNLIDGFSLETINLKTSTRVKQ